MSDNRICKFFDARDPVGSAGCCGRCHKYDQVAERCSIEDLVKEWMYAQHWEDIKDEYKVCRQNPDNS